MNREALDSLDKEAIFWASRSCAVTLARASSSSKGRPDATACGPSSRRSKGNCGPRPVPESRCRFGAEGHRGRRAAKIVIDDLDLAPAELAEPIPHGVLQQAAFLIVHHLVSRGLPNIEDRLAGKMMRLELFTHRLAPRRSGCLPPAAAVSTACAPSRRATVPRTSSGSWRHSRFGVSGRNNSSWRA